MTKLRKLQWQPPDLAKTVLEVGEHVLRAWDLGHGWFLLTERRGLYFERGGSWVRPRFRLLWSAPLDAMREVVISDRGEAAAPVVLEGRSTGHPGVVVGSFRSVGRAPPRFELRVDQDAFELPDLATAHDLQRCLSEARLSRLGP
ncbi:MAG: hypothetical protein KGJ23_02385 [Euryarchaeota archaeon]|nr:hypothetical protein [Euryarchaeota archaeon]MDE1835444.1 hypothetical protein [Euryarchaeota archaeon]MDE1879580.1 hypothetical protein [Euryarchaeota archaeon]MDE2046300.1 hypothetical protein [Thermoplasmata archaeon]